ncbi:MAG: alpha/beta fold hydrolase [Desulfobulbaceae bacterium]|nr:alpha/beta fold hydrolase [Desulfobulbaceae bacterium]
MKPLYQYPFTPKHFSVGSHRLSYVDEGNGPTVVMVHGNPSWSYLYRNLIARLQKKYRCIAPDHLGCGFSDKPQDYPYRLQNHIDNLEQLLDHLQVKRCVLVVHDWGGAIGMGWAGRHPKRIAGLVVLNTAAFFLPRIPFRISLCRWPLLGALLVRGLNGFARPAVSMAVKKKMDDRVAAGFIAPYDSWANRVAIHRFVQDIPMHRDYPSRQTLSGVESSLKGLVDKPMLICWGGKDFCFNRQFYDQWRRRFPGARACYFPEAVPYVLEDAFEEILHSINPFLQACYE